MQIVEHVVIAERALSPFMRELENCKPSAGDVVALVYMASFINRDGTPVDGFAPGYTW